MRVRFAGIVIASLALALGATVPANAGAQQAAPSKPATAPQPREASVVDELFMPPMRGTPDGRISGGTRGLHKPSPQAVATPAAPPVRPAPGAPGAVGQ